MKRGQTTLFIIIGILIISLIIGFFYLNNKKDNEYSVNKEPVGFYVQGCLKNTLEKGAEVLGFQGGYYDDVVLSKSYLYYNVPYYWNNEKDNVPSLEIIKTELSEYLEENIGYCINDFKIFNESDYEFTKDNSKVKSIKVYDDEIEVDLEYRISIKKGDSVSEIKDFSSEIKVPLKKARDISEDFIEVQKTMPNEFPLGFLIESSEKNNYEFEIIELNDNRLISLNFESYMYVFAVSYDWEELRNETEINN